MELFVKKRINIIAEKVCQDMVVELIQASGASGFTVYKDIYGKGRSGVRGDFGSLGDVSGNLEIVCIAGTEVAERILQGLVAMIEEGLDLIVCVEEVQVLRDDHFD
jgi:PII-like signaling protein